MAMGMGMGMENPILAAALTQPAPVQPPVVNTIPNPPMTSAGPPIGMGHGGQQCMTKIMIVFLFLSWHAKPNHQQNYYKKFKC